MCNILMTKLTKYCEVRKIRLSSFYCAIINNSLSGNVELVHISIFLFSQNNLLPLIKKKNREANKKAKYERKYMK